MYRKVPADILEGSKRGSFISVLALFVMATLFVLETRDFFSSSLVTDLSLDSNKDPKIRVNFNITMMDLSCEYATVDVVSVLGTQQNVTTSIRKWSIDAEGVKRYFNERNLKQHDIKLKDESVKESIDELHEDGEDAVSLDDTTLQYARDENQYLFVDFYASWCSHCRDLAPTWETLAEVMNMAAEAAVDERIEQGEHKHDYSEEDYAAAKRVELPVMIAKVDCVTHKALCQDQGIRAYPTIRLFIDGKPYEKGDYRGHRTVLDFTAFLSSAEGENKQNEESGVDKAHEIAKERLDISAEELEWSEKIKSQRHRMHHAPWVAADHPGCQITGILMLDRVPGNFNIQARSSAHNLVPHMTNVSHEVHYLSFGDSHVFQEGRQMLRIPPKFVENITPMNGNVYVTQNLHEAHHHYLKLVTTSFDKKIVSNLVDVRAYMVLQNSQLSYYQNDIVPEAKFTIDLSPIAVKYRTVYRPWYDYITSLMAILGGTFTVVGMFESALFRISARRHRKR